VAIFLSACGGGGSSGPPPPPQPTVTLDSASASLAYQSLYVENSAITVTPAPTAFTFANFPATPNVKLSAPTTGGINSLSFTMADASHGGITFTLRPPNMLSQATYDTPITVNVYADSTGDILVDTFNVTLHYTITNSYTVSGPNGYTIRALPMTTNGLAGNAKQNVIYANVLTDPATQAYSVEALDPTTGAVLYPPISVVPINAQSDRVASLALSDDSQYLYVGAAGNVERFKASGMTLDLTLPTTGSLGMAVAPGLPQTVAVAGDNGFQIVDNAVARPNSVPVPMQPLGYGSFGYLQWGSQSTVYASVNFGGGIGQLVATCAFAVDSAGVTANFAAPSTCAPSETSASFQPMAFADGLGYSGGQIVDPTTWTVVGTYPGGLVTPDATLGTGFAFGGCSIQSFNLKTGAAIASVQLPNVNGCGYGRTILQNALIRFGANGIAIGTGVNFTPGYIIVITGAFVAP
jgi:hypothetical protein